MRGELLVYSSLLFLLALLIAGVLFRAYINWQKPRLRMRGFSRSGLFDLTHAAVPGIIDYLRDAIIVVDRRDHITDINRSACRWLKVDPGCLGQRVFDVLPKADLFLEQWNIPDARILLETKETDSHSWYDVRIIEIRDRQDIPAGRVIVAHDNTYEQELLEAEKHKSAHLALLEEAGRQIAGSLDEKEIVQRTVEAVVNRFGYAEAAISLLIDEKELEVAAISGTQDYGFRTGYRQELGAGIIGYVGKTCKTYVANDVKEDPYYFSNAEHEGSAVGVPIMNEKELIGVLYVESAEKGSFKAADTQMMVTLANQVASSIQRARLYAGAQEHLRIMSIVQSISQVISSSLDLDGIFKAVVRMLKETFGYTYVSIYLLIDDYLHLGAQSGYIEENVFNTIHLTQGVIGHTARMREPQFIQDVAGDPNFLIASTDVRSEICIPLLKDEAVLGILNVEADSQSTLSQKDLELLTLLAGPIALAVDNARLHSKVKEMAMTDVVTGVFNRRAFEEMLSAEQLRSQRFSHPFSLIIFDLDSFKAYNDIWGHPAGDERLRATAELIHSTLRKYDIPARYGGDEFAIILPNTDKKGAMQLAGRLLAAARSSATEMPVVEGDVVPGYTLSIGVATYPQDGNTLASLLLAADQAELMAKRLGKNQIFAAGDLQRQ